MFACFAVLVLVGFTALLAQLGVVVLARHQAQAAADVAALAGARALTDGQQAGCAAADELVRRMRMRMSTCEVRGWDVIIAVTTELPLGSLSARVVQAQARAGPARETAETR